VLTKDVAASNRGGFGLMAVMNNYGRNPTFFNLIHYYFINSGDHSP
jgi:hypothetical protein